MAANSILGLDEQTSLLFVNSIPGESDELKYFQAKHKEFIGEEGTTMELAASLVRSTPGFTLKSLNVKSQSNKYTLAVSHPFVRSRALNFSLQGKLEALNAQVFLEGEQLSKDYIRTFQFGASANYIDALKGISFFNANIRQGLEFLGASGNDSPDLSRTGGRTDYTLIEGTYTRLQNVYGNLNLLLSVNGQYAFDELLSSEEYGVGGSVYGRGYNPSELTGDHGIAAKAEFQYGGSTDFFFLDGYQLYGFYDFGAVYEKGTGDHDSLASVGAGSRFNFSDWLSGYAEVAKPLTRGVADDDDKKTPRFFFAISARL